MCKECQLSVAWGGLWQIARIAICLPSLHLLSFNVALQLLPSEEASVSPPFEFRLLT